jgi:DNA-binding NtrC family response regulator
MVVNMAPAQLDQTNVLVVEDEMVLRMRAVDIVEDAGFTAVQAVNADEALRILEARSDIALLFSDIQMPGSMDGLKLRGGYGHRTGDLSRSPTTTLSACGSARNASVARL